MRWWEHAKQAIFSALGLRSTEWGSTILDAAAILLIAWVASIVVGSLLVRVVRRLTARTETKLDDQILALAARPTRRLVIVAGVYFALDVLPLTPTLHRVLTGVVFVAAVWIAFRVVTRVVLALVAAYGKKVQDPDGQYHFEKDYLPLISKVIGVVFFVIGLTWVLRHFGQDVDTLIAALGVGGIAISFASKETLGNMLAGFTILLDRPFRPGDRIKLASGEIGDVIDVGTRSTRVKLLDQNMLIVPNSELVNTRVVNYHYPSHAMQARLDVNVPYGTDVERAKQIILDAIRAQEGVKDDPVPNVQLTTLGDASVSLSAFYVIAQFADAAEVQDRVRTQVYSRFQAEGIKK